LKQRKTNPSRYHVYRFDAGIFVLYFAHANFIPSSASQIIMCANKWKNRSKTLEKIVVLHNSSDAK